MTILKCSAVTCVYNEDRLCSRGEITVAGTDARRSDETSCESFRERGDSSYKNSSHCGCEKIAIDCKAEECTYNSDCRCTAASIGIDGPNACCCEDTKCGTFQCCSK